MYLYTAAAWFEERVQQDCYIQLSTIPEHTESIFCGSSESLASTKGLGMAS